MLTLQNLSERNTQPDAAIGKRIAVLLPCHNEAAAIEQVVKDFRKHLPAATVYVYDNASTDRTADVARSAGASVHVEPIVGKGNVVRRMFADIEADIYVIADGDGTYDAARAPELVDHLIANGMDMVNCARVPAQEDSYRRGHKFGNRLLTGIVTRVFGRRLRD